MSLPNRRRHPSQIALPFIVIFIVSLPALGLAQLGGKPEKSNFTLSYTQASGAFTPI